MQTVMATPRAAVTYRDYAALPDDGRRYEIHDGELSVTPAPSPWHQLTLGELSDAVRRHVKAHALGIVLFAPVDVILADTTVVQPDLVYLDHGGIGRLSQRGVEGAPVLVAEVLSPATAQTDRTTKLRLYARHGVPYYWIVDADARVFEIYELHGGDYRLMTRGAGAERIDLLPFTGLTLALDGLWAEFPGARPGDS
jgi:Uma2 family endonuclease